MQNGPIVGLVLAALTLAPLASARQVIVQSQSPFRSGPNQRFPADGTVPVGAQAEVLGQTAGWVQLKLEDGRTGYVFQNNLRDVPEPPTPETSTSTTTAPPAASPSTVPPAAPLSDDLPTLKNEITNLRAKVESLSDALSRQRAADNGDGGGGLVERLPGGTPRDGSVSLTIAALLVGLFFGFLFSRVAQRRSDRRSWNKLRF